MFSFAGLKCACVCVCCESSIATAARCTAHTNAHAHAPSLRNQHRTAIRCVAARVVAGAAKGRAFARAQQRGVAAVQRHARPRRPHAQVSHDVGLDAKLAQRCIKRRRPCKRASVSATTEQQNGQANRHSSAFATASSSGSNKQQHDIQLENACVCAALSNLNR